MNRFLHNLGRLWPILGIAITVLILFLTNYKSGTYLTGWDNLHPEFNFALNIKRSFFAVWQEYQGLGLLGGMGHAADLVHQIFLLLLSYIFPNNMLRYIWTFLMLFTGSLGMYFFLKQIFFKKSDQKNVTAAFLGAFFYLLNLSTIQTFYAPFEAFIGHFASLPWLLLSSILFLHTPNKKNTLFVSIVLLLSTPQAYIPTLFVVYILSLTVYFLGTFFQSNTRKQLVKTAAKLAGLIAALNTFWLLPFIYFTISNSNVNVNSKINQMATQTIFSQNKEFGTIVDTILLKGFWFANIDPDKAGNFAYMLLPWKAHMDQIPVSAIGFFIFAVIILGIYICLRTKNKITFPFIFLFVFAFTMLATATPPFSWFDNLFRFVPLFGQAFRFPFTKFSILAGFSYSIFFALGFYTLLNIAKHYLKRFYTAFLGIFFILLLAFFSFPVFQGHLIYDKERLSIPQEYFQVFNFFDKQEKNSRIANFPQQTFWGWTFYKWGYGGSGFLWHGIKQPILDRAFDVWSREDEQYYFEVSNALYSKDAHAFENVLNKYQISWLLVDKNIISPQAPKSLFTTETASLFNNIPEILKTKTFGNIDIYKVNLKNKPKSFIYAVQNSALVSNNIWKNQDNAYADLGTYQDAENGILYPFSGLFSVKTEKENNVTITENSATITLKKTVDASGATLTIPEFSTNENIVPANITYKKDEKDNLVARINIISPKMFINGEKIWGGNVEIPAFVIPNDSGFPLTLDINGTFQTEIKQDQNNPSPVTFLSLKQDNIITLKSSDSKLIKSYILPSSLLQSFQNEKQNIKLEKYSGNAQIVLEIPKIQDGYLSFSKQNFTNQKVNNCDNFRNGIFSSKIDADALVLYSKNATACINYYNENLLHSEGYVVFLQSKNIQGRGLHFWVLNEDEKIAPIDTYIAKTKDFSTHAFVIAPMETNGRNYSFHLENISIADEEQNSIRKLTVFQIPYRFASNITLSKEKDNMHESKDASGLILTVKHPNDYYYSVSLAPSANSAQSNTLILSQTYNPGWKAYYTKGTGLMKKLSTIFPTLFGKELKQHVSINSWENGWIIPENTQNTNSQIIIVFLPQYLEFAGCITLLITCGFVIVYYYSRRKKN